MNNKTTESKPPFYEQDPYLRDYIPVIKRRIKKIHETEMRLTGGQIKLSDWASGHTWFGLQRTNDGWAMREWAPHASQVALLGDFNNWKESSPWFFSKDSAGVWELKIPAGALQHGQHYKLLVSWPGGSAQRIPAYVRRAVQDSSTLIFSGQVWAPENNYQWKNTFTRNSDAPRVYEAHAGMAQETEKVGTWNEFRINILPRIKKAGYNTIQLMAVQEHPYYGSFGYHVSNFFASTSRCGTPEELKELVDCAHGLGMAVIMDLVHSHAVKNENEGLSRLDGTDYQYFHSGDRGSHIAWDSKCFNYGKTEVLHFLLSNCRFWLDEYRFDGYRFDGVTSMLYYDHGLGKRFTSYDDYFSGNVDEDAYVYLALANKVIHEVRPDALSIAEDMSGMPGLGAEISEGGLGFDYRLAMGTPDYWIKLIKEQPDEKWNVCEMYHELTNRRADEKSINYAESHDQALVGDKTIIFRLCDKEMYFCMSKQTPNLLIDRGLSLHKMIRLITLSCAGHGWLNFMGNEFGHPEWIDFPREGNNWSYKYARRQWKLRDDPLLKYHLLADFDEAMMKIIADFKILESGGPWKLHEHISDQVLSFHRAGLIFVFNFNPVNSYTGYGITGLPGEWKIIFNSDSTLFGGFSRIDDSIKYPSRHEGGRDIVSLYLPARTALVLAKKASV